MTSWGSCERCYHTHAPLQMPGSQHTIYGGSCSTPAIGDADVYIGFDYGMTFTARAMPWHAGDEFLFPINDGHAPRNAAEFRRLVDWTKEQMAAGRKLHCGCIGGHGRTGTFLAALASTYGCADAIAYVRKHYCAKAVETQDQVDFLKEHWHVTPQIASRSLTPPRSSRYAGLTALLDGGDLPWQSPAQVPEGLDVVARRAPRSAGAATGIEIRRNVVAPRRFRGSLWDRP